MSSFAQLLVKPLRIKGARCRLVFDEPTINDLWLEMSELDELPVYRPQGGNVIYIAYAVR